MAVFRMLPLAPVLALAMLGATGREAPKKCGTQGPTGMIYFVNGDVKPGFTRDDLSKLKDNTFWLEHLCMDPQDSTLYRLNAPGAVGYWTTSVWTNDGPGPHVLLALDHIRYAQNRHFKQHKRYINSASEIVMPQGMERVRVTVQGDERGWVAHTTIPRFMQTCTMFEGDVYHTGPATVPGRVQCKFDDRWTP